MSEYQEFWNKVLKTDTCWLWQGCVLKRSNKNISYGQIRWQGKQLYAHRLAWELTYGPVPERKEVCHSCDNPICVRPDHLFLGTHSDNMQDAKEKKRMHCPSGENCNHSKLTVEQVKLIKQSTLSQGKLAEIYHVSKSAIYFILNGRNWKGVTI